eukprot:Skav208351  [mRNA]  locus=C8971180:560:1228:+ [translate_table: standard]
MMRNSRKRAKTKAKSKDGKGLGKNSGKSPGKTKGKGKGSPKGSEGKGKRFGMSGDPDGETWDGAWDGTEWDETWDGTWDGTWETTEGQGEGHEDALQMALLCDDPDVVEPSMSSTFLFDFCESDVSAEVSEVERMELGGDATAESAAQGLALTWDSLSRPSGGQCSECNLLSCDLSQNVTVFDFPESDNASDMSVSCNVMDSLLPEKKEKLGTPLGLGATDG